MTNCLTQAAGRLYAKRLLPIIKIPVANNDSVLQMLSIIGKLLQKPSISMRRQGKNNITNMEVPHHIGGKAACI